MSNKTTATIRIQWIHSAIGCPEKHKLVIRGLGLRRLQHVVERPDTPSIRGMVAKVPHLVRILE
ncbi:MAG TPA: 50S ribosomal protein L30 [bacterium]